MSENRAQVRAPRTPGIRYHRQTMRIFTSVVMVIAVSACQVVYDADDFRHRPGDDRDARVDAPAPQGDAGSDAPVSPTPDGPLPTSCEALCTNGTCVPGIPEAICEIDCGAPGVNCVGRVECPPGISCLIYCGDGHCEDGIDCADSDTCNVVCTGDGSCGGDITCGPAGCTLSCSGTSSCNGVLQCGTGYCDINCFGVNSCNGTIDCTDSCECDTDCLPDTCLGTVSCPTGCVSGNTCDRTLPGCAACS